MISSFLEKEIKRAKISFDKRDRPQNCHGLADVNLLTIDKVLLSCRVSLS